jgi:hypothetical protein
MPRTTLRFTEMNRRDRRSSIPTRRVRSVRMPVRYTPQERVPPGNVYRVASNLEPRVIRGNLARAGCSYSVRMDLLAKLRHPDIASHFSHRKNDLVPDHEEIEPDQVHSGDRVLSAVEVLHGQWRYRIKGPRNRAFSLFSPLVANEWLTAEEFTTREWRNCRQFAP